MDPLSLSLLVALVVTAALSMFRGLRWWWGTGVVLVLVLVVAPAARGEVAADVRLDELGAWHDEAHEAGPPPPSSGDCPACCPVCDFPCECADPEPPPGDCFHPAWPFVVEGDCVELGGRLYSTRDADDTEDLSGGEFRIGLKNGTGTILPASLECRGSVSFEVFFEPGSLVEARGGGKHFHVVTGFLGDRAGAFRDVLPTYLGFEVARLSGSPILLARVLNGNGQAVATAFPKLVEGRWYSVRLAWNYSVTTGAFDVSAEVAGVGGAQLTAAFPKGLHGPGGFFMPFGHVQDTGGVPRFRSVAIGER